MFTNLLKSKWKYVVSGLMTPALIVLMVTKVRALNTTYAHSTGHNPYANLRAFLIMIQYAEGTYGKNAYRTLFGGGLFSSFKDHPNTAITRSGLTSTAAGAYQILYRTWITVQRALVLENFSPSSQDKAATELIRRRGALEDVLAGRLQQAVEKSRREWASLPGAGYGQREHSFNALQQVYIQAGGQMA